MMTLEQIRQRNKAENAAAQPPAGCRVSAGRMGPPHRAADRRPDHRREHQRTSAARSTAFPTWQDAAAALLG